MSKPRASFLVALTCGHFAASPFADRPPLARPCYCMCKAFA